MELNVETLREALEEMQEFWEAYRTEQASGTPESSLSSRINRAAVVKAFEFTYESAIRFIRRQLSEGTLTDEELKAMNFRDMLRAAADSGLIAEPIAWIEYREIRNTTSHVYGKSKSSKVLPVADNFLKDVHFLLAELTRSLSVLSMNSA